MLMYEPLLFNPALGGGSGAWCASWEDGEGELHLATFGLDECGGFGAARDRAVAHLKEQPGVVVSPTCSSRTAARTAPPAPLTAPHRLPPKLCVARCDRQSAYCM